MSPPIGAALAGCAPSRLYGAVLALPALIADATFWRRTAPRGEPKGTALRFSFYTPPTARQGRPGPHGRKDGHPSRCNRDLRDRFGEEAYAAEKLVAELGAAFVYADLALAPEPRPDHAACVASWLKVLRSDKRAIFTAATKAQAAADWMHTR